MPCVPSAKDKRGLCRNCIIRNPYYDVGMFHADGHIQVQGVHTNECHLNTARLLIFEDYRASFDCPAEDLLSLKYSLRSALTRTEQNTLVYGRHQLCSVLCVIHA